MRGIFNGGLFLTGLFLSRKSALLINKAKENVQLLISANIAVIMFFSCIPYLIIIIYLIYYLFR